MIVARWKLYAIAAAIVAGLWWTWRKPAVAARVKKALEIDDNVYSPTFGQPMPAASVFAPQPQKSDVQQAIEDSSAAIDGYVVPLNPWGIS